MSTMHTATFRNGELVSRTCPGEGECEAGHVLCEEWDSGCSHGMRLDEDGCEIGECIACKGTGRKGGEYHCAFLELDFEWDIGPDEDTTGTFEVRTDHDGYGEDFTLMCFIGMQVDTIVLPNAIWPGDVVRRKPGGATWTVLKGPTFQSFPGRGRWKSTMRSEGGSNRTFMDKPSKKMILIKEAPRG